MSKCEQCRYWEPIDRSWEGSCRRYPPAYSPGLEIDYAEGQFFVLQKILQCFIIWTRIQGVEATTAEDFEITEEAIRDGSFLAVPSFPRTKQDDWCGEYNPKDETKC